MFSFLRDWQVFIPFRETHNHKKIPDHGQLPKKKTKKPKNKKTRCTLDNMFVKNCVLKHTISLRGPNRLTEWKFHHRRSKRFKENSPTVLWKTHKVLIKQISLMDLKREEDLIGLSIWLRCQQVLHRVVNKRFWTSKRSTKQMLRT